MARPNNHPTGSFCSLEDENMMEAEFFSIYHKYQEKVVKLHESHKKMDMIYNYMVKNQIKLVKDTDPKEEKVRKTRKDKDGRKFICGACKLGYLSYPALYTHIKTKHKGATPQGTIRGESGKPKKRGRPKVRKTPQIYEREMQKSQFPKQLSWLVIKQSLQILEEYDIEAGQDEFGSISLKYFVGIGRQLKKLLHARIYLLPIAKLVTTFLDNIKDFVSQPAMENFEQFFYDFLKYINQHYFNILTDYTRLTKYYITIDVLPTETYCEVSDAFFVPVFAERYIKLQLQEDDEMLLTLLLDFCKWLHAMKLSNIKLVRDVNCLLASQG